MANKFTDFFAIRSNIYCYFDYVLDTWIMVLGTRLGSTYVRINLEDIGSLFKIRTSHLDYDGFTVGGDK